MPRFVVYEIWTRARVVEAHSMHDALTHNEPAPMLDTGLSLSNWHAQPLDEAEPLQETGGMNFRQEG